MAWSSRCSSAWDERGRLWALCTPSYPQLIPGIAANDYILVCEDTDGDGRADKFDALCRRAGDADRPGPGRRRRLRLPGRRNLSIWPIPMATAGPTERRVVFSGFGTGDSHQMINSLCWGPDGRLWFTQGLHIDSTIETPWGLARCTRPASGG